MTTRRTLFKGLVLATFIAMPGHGLLAAGDLGLKGDIEVEKGLAKGLDMGLSAEYMYQDCHTDDWGLGISLSKRLYRSKDKSFTVKAAAGYKFTRVFSTAEGIYKGDSSDGIADGLPFAYYMENGLKFDWLESYWRTRHKAWAQIQIKKEFGRFTVSFKERYQFSHSDSIEVGRDKYRMMYNADIQDFAIGLKSSDTKMKDTQRKNMLRSTLRVAYDIKGCKLNPFMGIDLYNSPDSGMRLEKTRLTGGIERGLGKNASIGLAYLWQNKAFDDEPAGSAINLSFSYAF